LAINELIAYQLEKKCTDSDHCCYTAVITCSGCYRGIPNH